MSLKSLRRGILSSTYICPLLSDFNEVSAPVNLSVLDASLADPIFLQKLLEIKVMVALDISEEPFKNLKANRPKMPFLLGDIKGSLRPRY
jgi:hypothetical protein